MASRVNALLFDLGGVIIDIDFGLVFTHLASSTGKPAEHFRSRFSFDLPYQQHERGEINSAEYFTHLRQLFDITLTDAELDTSWNQIYIGIVPGVTPLLQSLKGHIPLYGFTNSNAAHRAHWSVVYAEELAVFDHVYDSSVIGLRKPDAPAFEYISAETNIPLHNILFFDDTRENIDAANQLNIQTVHVTSFQDTETAIKNLTLPEA